MTRMQTKALFHHNIMNISERNHLPLRSISSFIAVLVVFAVVTNTNKPITHDIANLGHASEKSEVNASHHHSPTTNLAQLQEMIDSTEEVIITMPAKAAGTSLKQFANDCYGKDLTLDNYLNYIDKTGMKELTRTYELPKVMASHMYNEKNFIHLIKNVPSGALMIYSHRDETDRLLSAINEAITNWCRGNNGHGPTVAPPDFFSKRDDKNCFILEKTLIERAIKQGVYEIGIGSTRLLTCTLYETLETNAPNFFFMDSRKASELMSLVAAKYCPTIVDKPVVANAANEKEYGAFVQMKIDTEVAEEIPLREWLNVKRGHLELLLGLNNGASCRAKTRVMEKMLFSSGEGFVSADDVIAQFH